MNIRKYNDIWNNFQNSSEAVLNDIASIKLHDDNAFSSITYTIFPPENIQEKIQFLADKLQQRFPEHHYFPLNYYHISINHLITYKKDEDIKVINESITRFRDSLSEITPKFKNFPLRIQGLNHFKNCVFAQVFSPEEILFNLNKAFEKTLNLQSFYSYVPHIAMIYFKQNPKELYEYISKDLRNIEIGEFTVEKVHLVKWLLHRSSDVQAYEILEMEMLA